jgi:hypothetical protein
LTAIHEPLPSTGRESHSPRDRAIAVFLLAIAPVVIAIWTVPWFVTQDGPAHIYNARIIADARDPRSPFRDFYEVRWEPLPNWAGHLMLVGLVSTLPARAADRVMMTVTFAGLAASIVWLRRRVAGWNGMAGAALLAVLLGLNVTWLFGFQSFLLGACLFPITLGVWWEGRDRLGPGRLAALAALLVVGYFCHLVSLGLTAGGLLLLAILTPGPHWRSRLVRTALVLLPLVPLGLIYLSLSRSGGAMQPAWHELDHPLSPATWIKRLGWVDPISIASREALPFVVAKSRVRTLLAPVVWLGIALLAGGIATIRSNHVWLDERRGWLALAVLLIVGGLIGPDSLGPNHGDYLAQRVLLLGLVALVPVVDLSANRWAGRIAVGALVVAVAVQSAFVWDYALDSNRNVGAMMRAAPAIGRGQRVATLLTGIRGRFRPNPLRHADNWLGVEPPNIIWNNYETRYYYFPVQFRAGLDRPGADELERISITDDPRDADARAAAWTKLLERHHGAIDVLFVWGHDARLHEINLRWFRTAYKKGRVRVLRHLPE